MSSTIHVTKASSYKGMASGCVKQMAAGVVYSHLAKVCLVSSAHAANWCT